jgi:ribose transport system permease protein
VAKLPSYDSRLLMPLAMLVLYLACIYAAQPAFFALQNLSAVLYYTCLLVPVELGIHLLIVLGLFDLSVGAVAAACGVVAALLLTQGLPLAVALSLGVVVGMIFGLINWVLTTRLRLPALISTLITMGGARAVAVGITQGQTVAGLPSPFGRLTEGTWLGLRYPVILGLVLVCLLEVLSSKHVVFRRFYHAGSNRRAALNCGINVSGLECLAFVLCGAGASVVGLLQSSRTMSASPHAFPDLALDCIAACVIGGDRLTGGAGRVSGAFFGLLMVVVSRNLVFLAGISAYWQDLAIALILLGAAVLNRPAAEP